jgi:hypothetical protein
MAICITLYNENWQNFQDTMCGIFLNLAELAEDYGTEFLDKIAIVMISDGYEKLEDDFMKNMTEIGLFKKELMENFFKKTRN